MKEYGGYIELEEFTGQEYYQDALAFNSGRSCLGYLIENKKIHEMYIPYFMCATVRECCERYQVKYNYYHIDEHFVPILPNNIKSDAYIYIVNFYGQLDNSYIQWLKRRYGNIILDNTQDFFRKPMEYIDTIYVCRKFFGVADGAYLYTDISSEKEYQADIVCDRMDFILGRYEKNANVYYESYQKNNDFFSNKEVMLCSKLSRNLLKVVDYQKCHEVRTANYEFLFHEFLDINRLELKLIEGAFAYPLYITNGRIIRKLLIEKKIYVPTLWMDVLEVCKENELEAKYALDILPLPVDQRYTQKDMKFIANTIKEIIFNLNEGVMGN